MLCKKATTTATTTKTCLWGLIVHIMCYHNLPKSCMWVCQRHFPYVYDGEGSLAMTLASSFGVLVISYHWATVCLWGYGDGCVECGYATSLLICQRPGGCGNATFLSVSIIPVLCPCFIIQPVTLYHALRGETWGNDNIIITSIKRCNVVITWALRWEISWSIGVSHSCV